MAEPFTPDLHKPYNMWWYYYIYKGYKFKRSEWINKYLKYKEVK